MNRWRGILIACAALGWWGAIYPQFTMVKGTYAVIYGDVPSQEENTAGRERSGRDIYWEIMKADKEQIHYKSRLFTAFEAWQEHLRGEGE